MDSLNNLHTTEVDCKLYENVSQLTISEQKLNHEVRNTASRSQRRRLQKHFC